MVDLEKNLEALKLKYLAERDKRLRSDGEDQYTAIGNKSELSDDPYVEGEFSRDAIVEDVEVLILGGGHSGLLTANALTDLGITDIRIIDRASDFGGTWYWNRYPGCRSDVEAYIYMPLCDHGEMPDEKYARSSVIFDNARRIASRLGLYGKTHFRTTVTEIRWAADLSRWIVSTDRGDTVRARFVCLGSGPVNRAKLPAVPGIDAFSGHMFHTSRWDYKYTGGDEHGNLTGLADKRVAIIGTGATAVQAIPYLGEFAKHLYVVQRTPAAVDERNNRPTDPNWWNSLKQGWWKQRAINFDSFLLGIPQQEDLVNDGWTETWARFAAAVSTDSDDDDKEIGLKQRVDFEKMKSIRSRIDRIVENKHTAEALKPYYNWFCKRPLFNDGYYETFNRPNVTLVDTDGKGLDRITERGIVSKGEEFEVDCIILASGFEVCHSPDTSGDFNLVGMGGVNLKEAWSHDMKSLHGMFTRGFPNLGIIGGLRQAAFTFNLTYTLKAQAEHLARVIKRCIAEDKVIFNVKSEAQTSWLKALKDKSSADWDFISQCTPGYYNDEGKNIENSLFANTYGEGAFAYFEVLDEWFSSRFEEDLELE